MEFGWVSNKGFSVKRVDPQYYIGTQNSILQFLLKNHDVKPLNSLIYGKIRDFGSFSLTNYIDYVKEGVPYFRSENVRGFFPNESKLFFITNKVHGILNNSQIKHGDILLNKMGTIGGAMYYSDVYPAEANGNATVAKFQVNKEKIDPYFLVTFLNCKFGDLQIQREAIGAVQKRVNLVDLDNIAIPIVPQKIQTYIGNKVRKAEQLHEEIKYLKKEVNGLFYSYTSLDPYDSFSSLESKDYGLFVDPQSIGSLLGAEVYKSDYVENQRKIRSLTTSVNLDDCFDYIVNGVDCRNYVNNLGTPYYKVAVISMYGVKETAVDYINMSLECVNQKQKIKEGDLLITRKGSFGICMGVDDRDTKGIISSEVFKVRLKTGWDADFLAYFLNSEYGQKQFLQYATGSTMKGISQENIGELLVPKIEFSMQEEIGEVVRKIKNHYFASKQLIQEAKQDIESYIEGTLDESIITEAE